MSTRSGHSGTKVNRLLQAWPKGAVATTAWLKAQGISRQLAARYQQAQWITPLGKGAYARSGDSVDWTGALSSIQRDAPESSLRAAGKTALSLHGFGHFVSPTGQEPVWITGSPRERLPVWFKKSAPWASRINYFTANLWANVPPGVWVTTLQIGENEVSLSTPECAILEVLHLVPQYQSLEEARQLMVGLTSLRTVHLSVLLERGGTIKVRRLFLALAEESGHQWFRHIDVSRIALGAGNRSMGLGGKLHPRYQIALPPP
jgi:hypothetical protein